MSRIRSICICLAPAFVPTSFPGFIPAAILVLVLSLYSNISIKGFLCSFDFVCLHALHFGIPSTCNWLKIMSWFVRESQTEPLLAVETMFSLAAHCGIIL